MSDPASPKSPAPAPAGRRNRLLAILAVVVVGIGILYGLWDWLVASRSVETDNAYVGADSAQVTPLVAGPVSKVLVSETQIVKAGQPLVVINDADARLSVEQAEAALGQAERRVRGYFVNDQTLAAQLDARQSDVGRAEAQAVSAKADYDRAKIDLDRRQALVSSGAVSGEELSSAQDAFARAKAAMTAAEAARADAAATRSAAESSREANRVLISGEPVEQNPEVAAARARLDSAKLALARTVLLAPIDGVVSKRSVQVGQQVQVGQTLMAVVPVGAAYVDANFKEGQLRKVRIGQPATLTSDLYGGGVKFHGHVVGLSGGTGSAFSLIPAQNASGNWIKVVQRIPVRIAIDPADLTQHPLRVGLSMKTSIDVAG